MLEIDNLEAERGIGATTHHVALPRLRVKSGEMLAITGESGCGKSTVLEVIGLLLTPRRLEGFRLGNTRLNVADLIKRNDKHALARLRSHNLGFMLQTGGLLPYLSMHENIALPRRLQGMPPMDERTRHAIRVLKLETLLDKRPAALSIGERQRAAFVRAIAHRPELILADEPTAALDPDAAVTLFELFMQIVRELELAAVVVSHDWKLVQSLGLRRLEAKTSPGHCSFIMEDEHVG